jgi:hypothetical protein
MFYSKNVHFSKNEIFKIFLFFENSQIWNLSEQKKRKYKNNKNTKKETIPFVGPRSDGPRSSGFERDGGSLPLKAGDRSSPKRPATELLSLGKPMIH